MKKHFLIFLLAAALLLAVLPVQAGEELFWSNMNDAPVRNRPPLYKTIKVSETEEPVLVQRIRTYHWNSGEGAEPGTISVYEGETKIGSWQAVGRSGFGASNVYWDALVDVIFAPGHSYTIKDSDLASMSYNEGSENCGMFEVYGITPVPEGYIVHRIPFPRLLFHSRQLFPEAAPFHRHLCSRRRPSNSDAMSRITTPATALSRSTGRC